SEEPILRRRRPSPMKLRTGARNTRRAYEQEWDTREHDGHDQRSVTTKRVRETTRRYRRRDYRKAQDRGGVEDQHVPHVPGPDRLVDERPQCKLGDDHQDDCSQALGPCRPAEEQPPENDPERGEHSREAADETDRKLEHPR